MHSLQKSGLLVSIQDNVLVSVGLLDCFLGEVILVYTEGTECTGLVLDLELEAARLVLIKGTQRSIKKNFTLHRTFTGVKTTAGFGVLGLTINPLGIILNDLYSMEDSSFLSELLFIEI